MLVTFLACYPRLGPLLFSPLRFIYLFSQNHQGKAIKGQCYRQNLKIFSAPIIYRSEFEIQPFQEANPCEETVVQYDQKP